ncbi:hypothetical protein [Chamaesiphon sp.]|uniref:hypothetical protein n=1 Tax=Chamaesiphon sp. TaxID=2814140 RepID=UPI003593CAE5
MNKKIRQFILLLWIGTTLLIDLLISAFSFSLVGYPVHPDDSRSETTYNLPLDRLTFTQVAVTLLMCLSGLAWSVIVLLGTERLLAWLRFPIPGNHKFSKLSLGLFKFALIAIMLTIVIGNGYLIYDQIQGRAGLKYP